MRRLIILIAGSMIFALALAKIAQAQSQVIVVDHQETIVFGDTIRFWALFESPAPISKVEVLYRPEGALRTLRGEASLNAENEATFIHYVRANPGAIPAFSTVEFRYYITLQNGETVLSDSYQFQYQDNRFLWQSLNDPPFRVYWVEGDTAFGQAVLDAARAGLRKIHTLINIPEPEKLDIYVYPRAAQLQEALELNGLVLAAGHASPELGVMMVSLSSGPAQSIEIQRQIPHELMHIMLYEKLGDRYENIPIWFDEGLASLSEVNSNPDYYLLLQNAIQRQALLPMESLCQSFRLEASLFYLSYAQSESFTRFLYDNYGSSGLEALLEKYADGIECTRAPELVFDESFNHLEERWVRTLLGQENLLQVLRPLFPWLVLLVAMLGAPFLLAVGGFLRSKPTAMKQKTA